MRPAQKAPENQGTFTKHGCEWVGFNEAGAKSAGKRDRLRARQPVIHDASMRPAQKAPENPGISGSLRRRHAGFNEAGAKSAGKPVCAWSK